MREKINVLDVNIEHCSAKQALKAAVEYMDTPATSVIDSGYESSILCIAKR